MKGVEKKNKNKNRKHYLLAYLWAKRVQVRWLPFVALQSLQDSEGGMSESSLSGSLSRYACWGGLTKTEWGLPAGPGWADEVTR